MFLNKNYKLWVFKEEHQTNCLYETHFHIFNYHKGTYYEKTVSALHNEKSQS